MEARLRKDGDITIIHVYGHLSYEEVDQFAQACKKLVDQRVVFNFDGLQFVGSCGITPFFEAIQSLHQSSIQKPKLCCLSVEFRKYVENANIEVGEHYETEFFAVKSYQAPRVEMAVSQEIKGARAVGEEPIGRAYVMPSPDVAVDKSINYINRSNITDAKDS